MLGEGLYKVVECGSSLARRWVLVLVDSESSILPVRGAWRRYSVFRTKPNHRQFYDCDTNVFLYTLGVDLAGFFSLQAYYLYHVRFKYGSNNTLTWHKSKAKGGLQI